MLATLATPTCPVPHSAIVAPEPCEAFLCCGQVRPADQYNEHNREEHGNCHPCVLWFHSWQYDRIRAYGHSENIVRWAVNSQTLLHTHGRGARVEAFKERRQIEGCDACDLITASGLYAYTDFRFQEGE